MLFQLLWFDFLDAVSTPAISSLYGLVLFIAFIYSESGDLILYFFR